MWVLCFVFILCITLAMFGSISVSRDLCHSQQSAPPLPEAPGSDPVLPLRQKSVDLIGASQLQVESSQAHPLSDEPSSARPSSAPISKVAMCTSIKWEQPADLKEWVQYYEWLGVDAMGIIQNDVNITAEIAEVLAPFVESGFVQLEAWGSDTPAQREAFDKCFQWFRDSHDWVAFFDADEYLILLESGTTLHGLLEDYKDYPALAVNWIMFGSSGRQTRPVEGGMLRWYMQCRTVPEPHIKVIANSKEVENVLSPHPHNIYYKNQSNAVVENFDKVEHVYGAECEQTPGCETADHERPCRTDCNPMPGFKYPAQDVERIALFHYVTRSWEDYERKMDRGSASVNGVRKGLPFFECTQAETNSTGGICDEGIKAWTQCCSPGSLAGRALR